jgi:hypothetical protein
MYSLFMLGEQRRIIAYLDGLYPGGLLRNRQVKVNALPAHAFGRLQSASGEELPALMPSILDEVFRGEL